ncbi:hypothetical protein [Kitasatospora sp. NPDC096204]|uniref:hypothetical protein n=1 Tax=Kitasatospora sp. NPDC096204 TaxID=3364094 RepID=UPI0038172492
MNALPLLPVPDPRSHFVAPGYAGMDALVAGLTLPAGASGSVMSVLETSRELIRHSYFRYEFATVAVTHALFALEQVLAERLAVDGPLPELIERAVTEGLLGDGPAAELGHGVRLRDRLARGAATSADVSPERAAGLTLAVFAAVSALLRPSTAADADGGPAGERLARLWEEHWQAPFPSSFVAADIAGSTLILLDSRVAGYLRRDLDGGLDGSGVAGLWALIAELDRVVPLINEEYGAAYFGRLRTIARLAAERHLPPAT